MQRTHSISGNFYCNGTLLVYHVFGKATWLLQISKFSSILFLLLQHFSTALFHHNPGPTLNLMPTNIELLKLIRVNYTASWIIWTSSPIKYFARKKKAWGRDANQKCGPFIINPFKNKLKKKSTLPFDPTQYWCLRCM